MWVKGLSITMAPSLPCFTGRIWTAVMSAVLKALVRWVSIFLVFPLPISPPALTPLCLHQLSFRLVPFCGNVRKKKRGGARQLLSAHSQSLILDIQASISRVESPAFMSVNLDLSWLITAFQISHLAGIVRSLQLGSPA